MNRSLYISITTLLLLGCGENPKPETEVHDKIDSTAAMPASAVKVVRYFPDKMGSWKSDTLIANREIQILITSSDQETFVVDQFESEGVTYEDRYRDEEKRLVIKLKGETIVDTSLLKEHFVEEAGQDFLEIANLRGYWFDEISNDTIILFGVINKPETDWSYAFYHKFDLKSMTFTLEEHVDEEI